MTGVVWLHRLREVQPLFAVRGGCHVPSVPTGGPSCLRHAEHYAPPIDTVPLPEASSHVSTQQVIDQTLTTVFSESRRLGERIGVQDNAVASIEQLRAGLLGRDLVRLALVADGQVHESQELVLEAIDTVLQLLFWPAGAVDYTVPRAFWESDLGRLLSRAKFRACPVSDLVGIGVAAEQLGVSRPTVYRWMENRMLDYVYDEISGRMYVLRRGIDQYQLVIEQVPA